jgi:hypothetical protein
MKSRQSRNQVLVISAILGAVIGAIAGITLLKRVEQEGEERPLLTGVEGMSLGMLVVGLLRQVSNLGKPGKK